MTVSIVACGASAEGWHKVKCDRSIAVNDAWKWGYPTDDILVCNWPSKFPQYRLDIIKNSKPKRFFSNIDQWSTWFPNMVKIKLSSWDGHLYKERPDFFSHAHTSPFIAMSMAYKQDAKDIILWGADFVDHSTYDKNNPHTRSELKTYHSFIEAIDKEGVKVWLGAPGSALNLPVWQNNI